MITGASIAGNAAAYWLGRQRHDVTVVERSSEFRDGGQNIDVRGVGREVLRHMGLEDAALERGTGEEGTAWVDEHGKAVAKFLTTDMEGDGPTAEMEILRGDLARLLYEPTKHQTAYRFGDHVTAIDQGHDGASVTFASGRTERFDLVVVAEGVGSATRELVFPGENGPRWMDLSMAYFTIPRTADDDRLWRWYHASGGRSVSLRPDRHGTTRAMLSVQKEAEGEEDWDVDRQKAWLRETFADAGWEAPRVVAAMATTDDFYFDALRQVRMPRWSSGRVVLTGDAAWAVTPLGGIGATLALTGAYVLAGELALNDDVKTALAAYEKAMRPMTNQAQGIPKIVPRLATHTAGSGSGFSTRRSGWRAGRRSARPQASCSRDHPRSPTCHATRRRSADASEVERGDQYLDTVVGLGPEAALEQRLRRTLDRGCAGSQRLGPRLAGADLAGQLRERGGVEADEQLTTLDLAEKDGDRAAAIYFDELEISDDRFAVGHIVRSQLGQRQGATRTRRANTAPSSFLPKPPARSIDVD